jgi:hypothetical protein
MVLRGCRMPVDRGRMAPSIASVPRVKGKKGLCEYATQIRSYRSSYLCAKTCERAVEKVTPWARVSRELSATSGPSVASAYEQKVDQDYTHPAERRVLIRRI